MEEDYKVPKISELNWCIHDTFELKDYLQMELLLLQSFSFNLVIPTAAHFVNYYETLAVTTSDVLKFTDDNCLKSDESKLNVLYTEAKINLKKHNDYFLEISLQCKCIKCRQKQC